MSPESSLATVVVPVGPRHEHLGDQLDALAAQSTDRPLHVVLACNGCPPVDAATHVERHWHGPHTIEVIDASEVIGPSHARNRGWRHSSTPMVLFCDADDIVAPGWAQSLVRALDDTPLVGGSLDHDTLSGRGRVTWGATGRNALPRKFGYLPFVPSGTLGVRRSALTALGGFDESLKRSEDVDFSWRAQQAGLRVSRCDTAIVRVRRRGTWAELFRQASDDARFDTVLLRRHRRHGARWGARDIAREGAGVLAAALEALVHAEGRMKLASRTGRFLGHVRSLSALL